MAIDEAVHASDCTGQPRFCSEYKALEAEKAKALSAVKIDEQIGELSRKLTETAGVAAIDRGDPRAAIVSRVSGWELLLVQTWLSLLQVGIIEFMSTFGIFLSLNHGELRRTAALRAVGNRPSRRRTKKEAESGKRRSRYVVRGPARPLAIAAPVSDQDSPFGEVAKFAVDCLRPKPGATMSLIEIYPRYRTWCDRSGSRALDAPEFEAKFLEMCESFGFSTKLGGDATYCLELALTEVASHRATSPNGSRSQTDVEFLWTNHTVAHPARQAKTRRLTGALG